jgi:rhodanese-related sulfurtransferase
MVEEISPEAVREKLEDGEDVQVVDIRGPREFEAGHVPGAVNVPMPQLPRTVEDVDWGDDVVVACPIGQSSIQAARLIQSYEGVDDDAAVRSMAGGYDAWEYDLASGEGADLAGADADGDR